MEINLPVFDGSEQTIELIKLAALYYDRVNVWCPALMNPVTSRGRGGIWNPLANGEREIRQLYNKKLLNSTSLLQENGIVVKKEFDMSGQIFGDTARQLNAFLRSKIHYVPGGFVYNKELYGFDYGFVMNMYEILEAWQKEEWDDDDNAQVSAYYSALVDAGALALYDLICTNQNCISSTSFSGQQDMPADLMTTLNTATPILLPNFSRLDYEDILEMRLMANDELLKLRSYVAKLSSEARQALYDRSLMSVEDYIKDKINNEAIGELIRKVKGLKRGTFIKTLESALFASPAPMVATAFTDISALASIGITMGIIIGINTGKYFVQKKELVTEDPLYFTVKLRKYGKGK